MPLKVAVLINTNPSSHSPIITKNFTAVVTAMSPGSNVTFYDPIHARKYPDANNYDLIVLSGGTADPMGDDEWVVAIRKWLREMVRDHPKQKILGVCWGHQQLCVTFGGVVGGMEAPEVCSFYSSSCIDELTHIRVTNINLTPAGQEFFPDLGTGYRIHEFHRREIKIPAKGFVELAQGAQCFVNEQNTILSFQGHPEADEALAKGMLGSSPAYMGISKDAYAEIERRMEDVHDGERLWERIVRWVGE